MRHEFKNLSALCSFSIPITRCNFVICQTVNSLINNLMNRKKEIQNKSIFIFNFKWYQKYKPSRTCSTYGIKYMCEPICDSKSNGERNTKFCWSAPPAHTYTHTNTYTMHTKWSIRNKLTLNTYNTGFV